MLGAFCVDTEEILLVQTLRHTGSMHYIVERVSCQLLLQVFFRCEVQFDKLDAVVSQKLARTALSHSSPHIEAPFDGFLNNKRADKTAGPGN